MTEEIKNGVTSFELIGTACTIPDERAKAILDTWFGESNSPEWGHARRIWFRKNPAFDATLAERFASSIDEALHGELSGCTHAKEGSLALILLLDQFTRNCFRGTPRAFSGDPRALALARSMVSSRTDLTLPTPFHRAFCYMPFEHDESMASQQESLHQFQQLADQFDDPDIARYYSYAKKHANVIQRFGRFPHRNKILGRETTADELAWLKENGGF